MPTLQSMREQRGQAAGKIREMAERINTQRRDFNSEERVEWERVNKEYDRLKADEDRQARLDELDRDRDRRVGDPVVGREDTQARRSQQEEHRDLAFQAWLRRGKGVALREEHENACKALNFNPNANEVGFSLRSDYKQVKAEYRALSVGTTTAGGFTVPEGFVYNLEMALLAYSNVRGLADVMRTESGNDMPWPTVNDTGNTGELLAENTTFGASVDPTFGQKILKAYKYSSKPVMISTELIEDSAFKLASEVGTMLGERIGRIQNAHFTTGTGTAQPQGVVTGATLGKTGASATAIAADELFDLQHSVDPAYRADPSCRFMCHDNILLAIRKLKDSQNRYLWEPSMQAGVPDRLLNYPIVVNQQMASAITTGQKTILFGAFNRYKVRDVNQVRFVRLVERYADLDQVAFIAFLRSDGQLLNAGTNPIKYYAQA